MDEKPRSPILACATASSALLGVALLLPAAMPGAGDGIVTLLFLVPFIASAILAAWTLHLTFGRLGKLTVGVTIAGFFPALMVAAVAALVLGG